MGNVIQSNWVERGWEYSLREGGWGNDVNWHHLIDEDKPTVKVYSARGSTQAKGRRQERVWLIWRQRIRWEPWPNGMRWESYTGVRSLEPCWPWSAAFTLLWEQWENIRIYMRSWLDLIYAQRISLWLQSEQCTIGGAVEERKGSQEAPVSSSSERWGWPGSSGGEEERGRQTQGTFKRKTWWKTRCEEVKTPGTEAHIENNLIMPLRSPVGHKHLGQLGAPL